MDRTLCTYSYESVGFVQLELTCILCTSIWLQVSHQDHVLGSAGLELSLLTSEAKQYQ